MAGEESFAEMFEASMKSPRKAIARRDPEMGEVVQGEVVQIGNEFAFLDIGAKAEAMILLEELRNEAGDLTIQLGDKLEGHVVSVGGKEGGIVVSGKLQRGAGLRDQLRMAFEQGVPVEGLVTGVNKGGLDIDLGGVRGFLPVSQIELRYCQDPSSYVGRAMTLRVTRYDEDARNVVLSRRAILEVEQRAMAAATLDKLVPGAVFNGVVTSVRDYGAFVDVGGLEGLLHVSEMGFGRALRPDEVVKPGQRVEVVVLKVEGELGEKDQGMKISLSLKALMADPMDETLQALSEGARVAGKVVRLEPFGAFVELKPGVEGLIHISAMAERHVSHPREVVTLGQEIQVTVISLDRERRRIGLSLVEEVRAAQAAAAAALGVGEVVEVIVERVEPHGVVVKVKRPEAAAGTAAAAGEAPAPKGTILNGELNVPRGSDMKRLFPEGKQLKALIQSIEPDGRIRLSVRSAELAEERASLSSYSTHTAATAQAAGKATMGEMLRSKLGQATETPAAAAPVVKETKAKAKKATAAAGEVEGMPAAAKPTKSKKAKAAPAGEAAAAPAGEAAAAPAGEAAAAPAAAAAPKKEKAAKVEAPAKAEAGAAKAKKKPAKGA